MLTVALVVMVIFLFLRNVWATMIPSISVPLSIVGTFGVMYLLHYSIDNLSLMAMAICTGFVVDDAIVVIENITRYLEAGYSPMEAAMKGSREIGFTVLSMSTSLIGGLYSHPADGWDRRKIVPGICSHVERRHRRFAVCIADDDADDVRQIPEIGERQKTREALSSASERVFQARPENVCGRLALGSAPPASDACGDRRDDLLERLSLYRHSQGFLPAAGYGAHERVHPGRAGHFVSVDAAEVEAIHRYRHERSRRWQPCPATPAAARKT